MKTKLICLVILAVASDSPSEERRLKIRARPSIYEIGERKAVYCEGINVEADQIEWIDNNGNVVEFDGKKNVRVNVEIRGKVLVLFMNQVLAQDEGSWICRSKDGTFNETLKVVVGEKAVLDPNETKRADENKSVKLSCKIVKGSPPPVVLWYKEENITSPIEASQKGAGPVKYVLTSNKNGVHYLEIRKLSRDDDGKYLCKATQKKLFHYSIKVITLEVRYKPIFYNPEIRNQPDGQGSATAVVDVFAVLNNTKNITCGAYANPPAKFSWVKVKDNKDIKLGTDTIIEGDSSSTLTLNMADAEDAGEYKCTAFNDMGSSIIIFHVTLGEGPKPPDHISFLKDNLNHTFMTFEVTCQDCKMAVEGNYTPSQNDLPVTGYSFELVPYKENYVADWDHAEEIMVMIEDPQQTKFAVGPVANNTRYHARVRSVNLAGYSDWLEDQFIDYDHLPYTKFGVRLASSITTVLLLVSAFFVTMCY